VAQPLAQGSAYAHGMTFKSVQGQLQKQGHSKEAAGKILGAAAQKAKHPSANQKKVLRAQGKKVK
jgi:hypothetical protein